MKSKNLKKYGSWVVSVWGLCIMPHLNTGYHYMACQMIILYGEYVSAVSCAGKLCISCP